MDMDRRALRDRLEGSRAGASGALKLLLDDLAAVIDADEAEGWPADTRLGLLRCDEAGIVRTSNRAARDHLGLVASALAGTSLEDLPLPVRQEELRALVRSADSTRRPV
ncbi:MAG: PAS domain-containing protein, partial [Planctomycetota bacterium]